MKHYEYEINLFLDNELSASGQKEMFAHLSICEDCTRLFHQYNKLKSGARDYYSKIEIENTGDIVHFPAGEVKKGTKTYRKQFYFSSAAAAVLLLISIFQFYKSPEDKDLKKELSTLRDSINTISGISIVKQNHINTGYSKEEASHALPDKPSSMKNYSRESTASDSLENIIFKDNLFNLSAGQDNIMIVKDSNKNISKYFGGDYIDSPSVIELINLSGNNNEMTVFEKNLYNQLSLRYNNTNQASDSLVRESKNIIIKAVGQNTKDNNEVRDLKFHTDPYVDKNGRFHSADSISVRDLFLREGDTFSVKQVITPQSKEFVKRDSRYNDYLNSLKKEHVTQSDFLTPQILGN